MIDKKTVTHPLVKFVVFEDARMHLRLINNNSTTQIVLIITLPGQMCL
jgi:hypothetical protein